MIKKEYFEINGVNHIKRWSTKKVYLISNFDGHLYNTPEDLAELETERTYTESHIPIEDISI